VYTEGDSRAHLGDNYINNFTYNYGDPSPSCRSRTKQCDDEDVQAEEAVFSNTKKGSEEEQRLAKEAQRRSFLAALEFDAMDSRLVTISPAHIETCQWVVDAPEYVRWCDDHYLPNHHGVLWIKGKPGSGKSTLMKYALGVAHSRNSGDTILSFFFNARGQSLETSAEGMYRSLLHQLLSKLPQIYSSKIHVKQRFWTVELLAAMFQTSVAKLRPDKRIICYIDALDECTQDEVRDVVKNFEDLVDDAVPRGKHVSICLSSRHYPHITMDKFEALMLDNIAGHLADISKFVKRSIGRLSLQRSVRSQIETNLRERSSGIFLWVVLVTKILRENRDGGATNAELLDSLKAVPDKLEHLFASILEKPDKATITSLQWVLYSQAPLSPTELYFAIKTSIGQLSTGEWNKKDVDTVSIERFIMRSSRGLVESVAGSQPSRPRVQFIHESVIEHLLQGGLASLIGVEQLTLKDFAHRQLALWCLSYIQLDSPKYLKFPKWRPSLLSRFSDGRFPLFVVVVRDLFYHLERAYQSHAISVDFLASLPLRLLVCAYSLASHSTSRSIIARSATILFLLLYSKSYTLAQALLGACAKTDDPGIFTYGTSEASVTKLDINARCDGEFGSALGEAAAHGTIELLQFLLDHGAEVIPSRRDVANPLTAAVKKGRGDIVEFLLQRGADVNFQTSDGSSALMQAVIEGSVKMTTLLLSHGADVNLTGGEYGTILGTAIACRSRDVAPDGIYAIIIWHLLNHGALVNGQQCKSPLWIAADFLYSDMVYRMLDLGAEVDAREGGDPQGRTALYMVAWKSEFRGGSKDKERDSRLDTALTIEALLDGGADINAVCKPGGTALIAATARNDPRVVSILLAHGACIFCGVDEVYGLTALDLALFAGYRECARLLSKAQFPKNGMIRKSRKCGCKGVKRLTRAKSDFSIEYDGYKYNFNGYGGGDRDGNGVKDDSRV
jgi:ankyrin repeat protein